MVKGADRATSQLTHGTVRLGSPVSLLGAPMEHCPGRAQLWFVPPVCQADVMDLWEWLGEAMA